MYLTLINPQFTFGLMKKETRLMTISVDPKKKKKYKKAATLVNRSLSNWCERQLDLALKGGGGNRTRE
jgi:hypothetical protein